MKVMDDQNSSSVKIKPSYKWTKLGWIPEEWKLEHLGKLSINKGDYGINAAAVSLKPDLPRYLRITDIDESGYLYKNNQKSVDNVKSNEFYLDDGDIVFARTGATVGKTYLHKNQNGKLVFAGFLIRFRLDMKKMLPDYLKFYTETNYYSNWVKTFSVRSGQPGINSKEYCNLPIPLPPLPEQQKIANILNTWDKAIVVKQQLHAQKQALKKGLMQQLLTGKKRFAGFTEDWEEIKLEELGKLVGGGTPSTTNINFWNGEIPWISSSNLKQNNLFELKTSRFITKTAIENSATKLIPAKSILIVSRVGIGKVAINEEEICTSQDFTNLIPNQGNLTFLGYKIQSIIGKLISHNQGTSIKGFNKKSLENLKLRIPLLNEQRVIAETIQKSDSELKQIELQLALMIRQKQGLMQQLLTGEKRVKI